LLVACDVAMSHSLTRSKTGRQAEYLDSFTAAYLFTLSYPTGFS
jgi:hypothetical protein